MIALLFTLFCTLVFFLIGEFGLSFFNLSTVRSKLLIVIPFGYGLVAVIATLLYRIGLSTHIIILTLIVLVGFLVLRFGLNRRRYEGTLKKHGKVVIVYGGILILLWLPQAIGGRQFTVFQGNIWDTFGYVGSAAAFSHLSYDQIKTLEKSATVENPVATWAAGNLRARPSVIILYALLAKPFKGRLYEFFYSYGIFLLLQAAGAIAFLCSNVFGADLRRALLIGAVFTLGFWGQYIFDINAFSQVSSLSILVIWVALVLSAPRSASLIAFSCLFSIFGIFLYPENWLVHFAFLGGVTLLTGVLQKRWNGLFALIISASAGFGVAMFYKEGIIDFVLGQTTATFNKAINANGDFFQMFLKGEPTTHSNLVTTIGHYLSGLVGWYFLSPVKDTPAGLALIMSVIITALSFWLLWPLVSRVGRAILHQQISAAFSIDLLALLFLIGSTYLCARNFYWTGGKLLSYGAPYLVIVLLYGLCDPQKQTPWKRRLLYGYCILQIGFNLVRMAGAGRHDGIALPPPYPAISHWQDKAEIRWSDAAIMPALEQCHGVRVQIENRWLANYAMILAQSANVPFYSEYPVWKYLNGVDIGLMSKQNSNCSITEKKTTSNEISLGFEFD